MVDMLIVGIYASPARGARAALAARHGRGNSVRELALGRLVRLENEEPPPGIAPRGRRHQLGVAGIQRTTSTAHSSMRFMVVVSSRLRLDFVEMLEKLTRRR